MDRSQRGQVTRSAADVYDEFFVPALFAPWPGPVSDAAGLAPGQAVLDVACGTGVLAREAARRVQPGGSVIGLDRNDGMLAVARRKAP
jgi:ubiquinone/menaquinone biosynthesis C-methylase UbiE